MTKRQIGLLLFSVLLILERIARGSHSESSLFERELAVMVCAVLGLVIHEWWRAHPGLRESVRLVLRSLKEGCVL